MRSPARINPHSQVRLGHLGVSVTVGIELSPPDEEDGLLKGGGSLSKNITVGLVAPAGLDCTHRSRSRFGCRSAR